MNIQNVTGHLLEPHHFITFYLHPLLGGVVGVGVFSRVRYSGRALLTSLFVPVVLLSLANTSQSLAQVRQEGDLDALFRVVMGATPSGASVVSLPFDEPFVARGLDISDRRLLPFWLQAITGRRAFPQGERCVPELFTAWLFRGEVTPIGSCPVERRSTADAVLSAIPFHQLRRFDECQKLSIPRPVCELLTGCTVEFVVFEKQFISSPPEPLKPFFTEELNERVRALF